MPETLYRGKIVTLERWDGGWEVVRHAPAVAILVRNEGLVLGVRQVRAPLRRATWELPAGLIDPGETPEQAALRELAEEVQLTGSLTLVTRLYTSPGFTDELVYLFEATDTQPAFAEPDDREDLSVEWLPADEAWRAAASGALATSGVTLLGLQVAMGASGVHR